LARGEIVDREGATPARPDNWMPEKGDSISKPAEESEDRIQDIDQTRSKHAGRSRTENNACPNSAAPAVFARLSPSESR